MTWADGDFPLPLELDAAEPLSPPAAAATAFVAPPLRVARGNVEGGGPRDAAAAAAADPAVVVLPCDGLFDSLTADLLQQQGECCSSAAGRLPSLPQPLLLRSSLALTLHCTGVLP